MDFIKYLEEFKLDRYNLFVNKNTQIDSIEINKTDIKRYTNEYWTSKQRQANSLHEISYRACYKPQLPNFFITQLTKKGDLVYDPFLGRGTTIIEASLNGRNAVGNDINPLSKILCSPRLNPPKLNEVVLFFEDFLFKDDQTPDIDLSMFFHKKTMNEILSLRNYFIESEKKRELTNVESWIRMVLTNRLTGHSKGFLSVYTLPPNQAVSQDSQKKINIKRNQTPEYRSVKDSIINKSRSLHKDVDDNKRKVLSEISFKILNTDARYNNDIESNSVDLTVTSPPFLDVINYAKDNWLRCWLNGFDVDQIEREITICKKVEDWCIVMKDVLKNLYRVTKPGGYLAFEVGDVKNGKIRLDEFIVPLGLESGFSCMGILINSQTFTKTSSIWGIKNNTKGTNTNRIVVFKKN